MPMEEDAGAELSEQDVVDIIVDELTTSSHGIMWIGRAHSAPSTTRALRTEIAIYTLSLTSHRRAHLSARVFQLIRYSALLTLVLSQRGY